MVNTFVTDPDYTKSAKNLDRRRLNKQILEAKQILDILQALHHIVSYQNWEPARIYKKEYKSIDDFIDDYLYNVSWVTKIRKRYLGLSERMVVQNNIVSWASKDALPIRIRSNHRLEFVDSDTVRIFIDDEYKYMDRTDVIISERDDKLYTLGFSQHAIVRMWVGYEASLQDYINQHVNVYCSYTKKDGNKCHNSTKIVNVTNPVKPWWIELPHIKEIKNRYPYHIMMCHRAALLNKEITRKETPHYEMIPEFVNVPKKYLTRGYIWTGSFSDERNRDAITRMIKGDDSEELLEVICAPITSKAKPKLTQRQLRKKYKYTGRFILNQDGYVRIKF